ncbi:hypothetical protein GCM10017687_66170 [Streptomyces echinatus]
MGHDDADRLVDDGTRFERCLQLLDLLLQSGLTAVVVALTHAGSASVRTARFHRALLPSRPARTALRPANRNTPQDRRRGDAGGAPCPRRPALAWVTLPWYP